MLQIYKQKGYYSKDREKNIFFDVAIEIAFPGQKNFSILMLIECKNYNHKVPVDDAEEFFAKIQQISGANVKGIIASTNSFQEGTLKYSKSKGIGLARYFDKNSLEWVLERSPSSTVSRNHTMAEWSTAYDGLREQNHKSKYFDWHGYSDGQYTISSNNFFLSLVKSGANKELKNSLKIIIQEPVAKSSSVPFKSFDEIENLCTGVLKKLQYKKGLVPLEALCTLLSRSHNLTIERNAKLADGVLGEITFTPNKIKIDDAQANSSHRARFTLAHEIGHLLLKHNKHMSHEYCRNADIEIENPVSIGIEDVSRMEWQANCFASCLLLPSKQFTKQFLVETETHELLDRGHGLLFVDQQRCNIDTYHRVTSPLMHQFEVSRSVVRLRLKKLGFLNEPESSTTRKARKTLHLKSYFSRR